MSKKTDYDPNEYWYSISAIEDHEGCNRRRWFKKTCKLPTQQSAPTVFGDIGHACSARFFLADDRGLDLTGMPVNMYPNGWKSMKNRFGKDETIYTITEEEGVLIKTLLQKAITEGYLIREPGRKVEREFRHIVHREGKYSIRLIGFIDLDNPCEVTDFKFVKNMNYAMSVKPNTKLAIVKSTQMMTYAVVKYMEGHKGNLSLNLLYFVKDYDQPVINRRRIEVTELQVNQFYVDNTLPSMKEMLRLDLKYPQHSVMEWAKIPGPNDVQKECNRHYGKGCPFQGICSEHFTVQQYLTVFGMNINQIIGNHVNLGDSTMLGNKLIDICKKEVTTIGALQPVTTVAEVVTPEVTPAAVAQSMIDSGGIAPEVPVNVPVVPAVAEQPVPGQQTAPWYNMYQGSECMACKGNNVKGYNSKMEPCIVCDARNQQLDLPVSSDYDVTSDTNGILTFTLKGEATAVQAVAEPVVKTVEAPVEIVTPVAEVAAPVAGNVLESILNNTASANPALSVTEVIVAVGSPAPLVETTPAPLQVDTVPAAEKPLFPPENFVSDAGVTGAIPAEALAASMKAGAGTFDMMIGCAPIKGKVKSFQADTLLSEALHTISVAANKPIAEIEHFTLLQAIDANIPELVRDLQQDGLTVVCFPSTKGSAMDRLVEGLRIHADIVIAPIGI